MTKAPASPKSPRKRHPPFSRLVVEAVEASEKHCLSAKAIYDFIKTEYEGNLGAAWRDGAKGALKSVVAEGTLVKPKVSGLYYLEDSPELRKAKAAATKKAKAAAAAHAHEMEEEEEEEEEEAPETPKGRKAALAAKGGVKKVSASAARKKAAPAAAPARKAAPTAAKKKGAAAAAPESPRAARARSRAA